MDKQEDREEQEETTVYIIIYLIGDDGRLAIVTNVYTI
jgi:hypothetical protein